MYHCITGSYYNVPSLNYCINEKDFGKYYETLNFFGIISGTLVMMNKNKLEFIQLYKPKD